jgi:hypothetical protein
MHRALPPSPYELSSLLTKQDLLRFRPTSLVLAKFDSKIDGDYAARLLLAHKKCPKGNVKWKELSRADRKQAQRLWSFTKRGRPRNINPVLVLYRICRVCEANKVKCPQFRFSRPPDGGIPSGPMWRQLERMLLLASHFLAELYGVPAMRDIRSHADSIAKIVQLTRQPEFENICKRFGLSFSSAGVANAANTFSAVCVYLRTARRDKKDLLKALLGGAKLKCIEAGSGRPQYNVPYFFQFSPLHFECV